MSAPKNVKQPTDRKPKATEAGPEVVTARVRGIGIEISADIMDDFELLDDLARLDDQDPSRMPALLRKLAGDKYRELLETARDKETGKVTIEAGGALIGEIFEAIDPN